MREKKSLTVAQASAHFSSVINRAAFGKERVVITRWGRRIAAVVPIKDLKDELGFS